jgi:hypothetical protein
MEILAALASNLTPARRSVLTSSSSDSSMVSSLASPVFAPVAVNHVAAPVAPALLPPLPPLRTTTDTETSPATEEVAAYDPPTNPTYPGTDDVEDDELDSFAAFQGETQYCCEYERIFFSTGTGNLKTLVSMAYGLLDEDGEKMLADWTIDPVYTGAPKKKRNAFKPNKESLIDEVKRRVEHVNLKKRYNSQKPLHFHKQWLAANSSVQALGGDANANWLRKKIVWFRSVLTNSAEESSLMKF